MAARHNVFNGLAWGPDGWLWGLNRILSNSRVGKPGMPDNKRVEINCGVWRYHPVHETFEAVAWGTTNPWGLDFDDYGQAFITNCVINHLWHAVPGSHFQRMFGQDLNPHVYELMTSCADHIHWAGGDWQTSRGAVGAHSDAGGGHAHAGAMVYLGDNWPARYRNQLFTCNIHGNRLNCDRLEQHGGGYAARHEPDFLHAGDPWFRGLALCYGPDGGVYVSDWCDTGECHDYEDIHRENGRIYKITYGKPKSAPVDLAKLGDAELVNLQSHANDWHVRQARRLLQERFHAGQLQPQTHVTLLKMLRDEPTVPRRLRALWALWVTGGLDEPLLNELLADREPYVRAWALRLELEDREISPRSLQKLNELAQSDPSPVVRLHLASALQRMPAAARLQLASVLLQRLLPMDERNLQLLLWYGVESLLEQAGGTQSLMLACEIPLVRRNMARRLASLPAAGDPLARVTDWIADESHTDAQSDILQGLLASLEGRRQVTMPSAWPATYTKLSQSPSGAVRERATKLALIFGDQNAFRSLRETLGNPSESTAKRQAAMTALVEQRDPQIVPRLKKLIEEEALRGPALRALAAYDDPQTPAIILASYPRFSEADKRDAILTLASRPAYALAMFAAMEQGKLDRGDLSAFVARQLAGMKDPQVQKKVAEVWGSVRSTPESKRQQIAEHKARLSATELARADIARGRALFQRDCANCHKLFDAGGAIGPDLTGSQRANLDYVLENLLDPSAVVGRDFQMQIFQTSDGRVINGIVVREDDAVVLVQTQNDRVALTKSEIEARDKSNVSLMPEGQLARLSPEDLRDLVAYLASPRQVP
jgi:putative heme-binding domain-containing protein